MSLSYSLGIDFGTSGARACVMAPQGEIEDMARLDYGSLAEDEAAPGWREVLFQLIAQVPVGLRRRLAALAIDGTSATVLACDADLHPLHGPLMYHDARAIAEAEAIAAAAGPAHPAAMATSGLAKVLWLQARLGTRPATVFLNQADWLAAQLTGRPASDFHNALKMGLDPATGQWPGWIAGLPGGNAVLPTAVVPGADLGPIIPARALGLNPDCRVRAGTTDSIAAFLAAGARQPGEAVTSLGTTLALKLVSDTRVDDARYGVYSHWFGRRWLTGGASNAGGGVLRQFFSDQELVDLSARMDPDRATGLNYYPLPRPGERFPIDDPALAPRLSPQPPDRVAFLQGLLEGLAAIEAQGYARLVELGAPHPTRVYSAGGGAQNVMQTRIRGRYLTVPVEPAAQQEACYGTARLAAAGTALFYGDGDDPGQC